MVENYHRILKALEKVFIKLGEVLKLIPSSVERWSEMDREIKDKEQVKL